MAGEGGGVAGEGTGDDAADGGNPPFSDELEAWLSGDDPKTIGALAEVFAEKSFAVLVLMLMFPSALPIPTGGVTNVLEVIAFVVALQMVVGLRRVWLPARWAARPLGPAVTDKAVPAILGRVRWFERFARRRGADLLAARTTVRALGLVLALFVVGSFVAPPFSGLDTLPSLGAVVVCLGVVLEDVVVVLVGVLLGLVGAVLVVALGAAAFQLLTAG